MIADRIDLPFVKDEVWDQSGGKRVEDGRVGWRPPLPNGTPQPPECPPIGPPHFFKDQKVDPFFASWQVLAEFSSTKWRAQTPVVQNNPSGSGTIFQDGPNPGRRRVEVTLLAAPDSATFITIREPKLGKPKPSDWEFNLLVRDYVDERPDAMGEIIAQSGEFLTYFMDLLSFGPSSHPNTTKVMQAASLMGLFCVQYWKNRYKRVRPAQLFPGLLPPIATPGHAAFPSGHATQAQLVYRCLHSVLPTTRIPGSKMSPADIAKPGLKTLALRIARNREIAGLHYPSDSIGGRHLADKIFKKILIPATTGTAMPIYKGFFVAAKREWA